MKKNNVRKVVGTSLLLAVFLSTLFVGIFGTLLVPAQSSAIDSGGHATWIDPHQLTYTDGKGHTLKYRQNGPDNAIIHPSNGVGETFFESLLSEGDYARENPNDADICAGSEDTPASTIHVYSIGKSSQHATENSTGYKVPLGGLCGPDNGGDITLPPRPPIPPCGPEHTYPPNPKATCDLGSVSWSDNPSIMNYHVGKADLIKYGMTEGQEFDWTAGSTSSRTFTSTGTPADTRCSKLNAYITIEPYQTYHAAQFYAPDYPRGDNGGAIGPCTLNFVGWMNVEGNYPSPTYDKEFTANWISGNGIQLIGPDGIMSDWGVETTLGVGPIFTRVKLTQYAMSLSADDLCTTKDSTMTANPYLNTPFVDFTIYDRNCHAQSHFHVKLLNSNPDWTGTSDGIPSTNAPIQCPFDQNGLNYFMCPLFDMGKSAVGVLNGIIRDALYINTDVVFGDSFQQAYDKFRNIGLSFVVIAGLLMVASQAAGLEIFSAYTVRKTLPKLVVASIGMALAWPLMQFAITLSNDLGTAANDLITGPFNGLQIPNGPDVGTAVIVYLFGAGTIASAFIGLGALGLLSLLATVLIGLLIAFVTLVLRQIVVVLCIMLAPLAIAMSVLPGTEGLWKFWRSAFTGALVMFPIVMGFLASGEIVSRVAAAQVSTAGDSQILFSLIALVAYFIPFFMLPTAFRLGNNVIGNIYGLLVDRTKGRQEQLAKGREQIRATHNQEFKAGSRYGKSWLNLIPGIGTLGFRGATNLIGAQIGAGARLRGRNAQIAANRLLSGDAAAKINPNFAANMGDADFLSELAGFSTGNSDAGAKASLVPKTRQMRAAALDKLGQSQQFKGTRADVERMASSIGGANGVASRTLLSNFENASGDRPDLIAKTIPEGILKAKMSKVRDLKTGAFKPVFAGGASAPIVGMLNNGTTDGGAQRFDAHGNLINGLSPDQLAHVQGFLYGASTTATGANAKIVESAIAALHGGAGHLAAGQNFYRAHETGL